MTLSLKVDVDASISATIVATASVGAEGAPEAEEFDAVHGFFDGWEDSTVQ